MNKLFALLWLVQTIGLIGWIQYLHGRIDFQTIRDKQLLNMIVNLAVKVGIYDMDDLTK